MPIFAYGVPQLHPLADILYNLYFPLPGPNMRPEGGRIVIALTDVDKVQREDTISEYRLTIEEVAEVRLERVPELVPRAISLKNLDYKKKRNVLILMSNQSVRILYKVNRLHLILDQLL